MKRKSVPDLHKKRDFKPRKTEVYGQKKIEDIQKIYLEKEKERELRDMDIFIQEEVEKKKPKYHEYKTDELVTQMDHSNQNQLKEYQQWNDLQVQTINYLMNKKQKIQNPQTRARQFIMELQNKIDGSKKKIQTLEETQTKKAKQPKKEKDMTFEQNPDFLKRQREKKLLGFNKNPEIQRKFQNLLQEESEIRAFRNQPIEPPKIKKEPTIPKVLKTHIKDLPQKKQINDYQVQNDIQKSKTLKLDLDQLQDQNQILDQGLDELLIERKNLEIKIYQLRNNPNVIEWCNDEYMSFGQVPKVQTGFNNINIDETQANSFDSILMQLDQNAKLVVEDVERQLDLQNLDIQSLYHIIDQDHDGIITIDEVEQQIDKFEIDIFPETLENMIRLLSKKNPSGVMDQWDFIQSFEYIETQDNTIKNKLKELEQLKNPLILEERVLDLKYHRQIIDSQLRKQQSMTDQLHSRESQLEDQLMKIQKLKNKKMEKLESKQLQLEYIDKEENTQSQIEVLNQQKQLQQEQFRKYKQDQDYLLNQLMTKIRQQNDEMIDAEIQNRKNIELYQTLMIKETSLFNLKNRIHRDMQELNKNQILNVEYQHKYYNQKQTTNYKLKMNEITQSIQNIFAIRIQAQYRMMRQKKIYKQMLQKLYYSIRTIRKGFNYIKNRRLEKKFLKVYRQSHKIIKRNKQEIFDHTKQFSIMRDEFIKSNEYERELAKKQIEEKKKATNEQQQESIQITSKQFKEILFIQDCWRKKNEKFKIMEKLEFGDLSTMCDYCQKRKVDNICRICHMAFFCQQCFLEQHKSSYKKNHLYYSFIQEKKPEQLNPQQLKDILGKVKEKLSEDQLQKISQDFSQQDTINKGLIKLENAEKILKTSQIDKDLQQNMMRLATFKFVLSNIDVEQRFQDNIQLLERNKEYIDYQEFISNLKN